jgi:hypothetical protein
VTTDALILFASGPPAGVPGPRFVRGSQRIERGVEVRGDRLTSQAKVTFFDEGGTPVGPVLCATAEGERMQERRRPGAQARTPGRSGRPDA